jgi:hypothetical protein
MAAFVLAACPALAGCAGPRPAEPALTAWGIGPCSTPAGRQPPAEDTLFYSGSRRCVKLTAVVNQVAAFELIISPGPAPLTGVGVEAAEFTASTGTLSRENIRLYRHWPVGIERYPNWYHRYIGSRQHRQVPDALVPIDAPRHGQPFTILAGTVMPVWVEVRVPADARPGAYQGSLTIRDGAGHRTIVPVELNVLDVLARPGMAPPALARVQLSPLIAAHSSLDPLNIPLALRDEPARGMLLRAFRLLQEHGLSPFTPDVRPGFSQDLDGAVVVDWTEFDAFCGPLIDGSAYPDGRPAAAWPLPVDIHQPEPVQFDGTGSTLYAAVLKDYAGRCRAHFQEHSWLTRAFVDFDLPTPGPADFPYRDFRRLASILRAADPALALMTTGIPQAMAPFGWREHRHEDLTPEVDIWATPVQFHHPPTMKQLQAAGRRVWLPPDRPPFGASLAVEAPPVEARSIAWQAFLQQASAIYLPRATDCPAGIFDEPISDPAQASDGWLVYPGRRFGLEEPVPSVRLKQLQLGLQDAQLLRLLVDQGRGETARLLARSLIKAAGTDAYGDSYQDGLPGRRARDAATWELARVILEQEAADAVAERPGAGFDRVANQAAWARFLAATRRIELAAEPARMVLVEREVKSPLQGEVRREKAFVITHEATVRSELRTPTAGMLRLGSLPPNARALGDNLKVGPLEEFALARAPLAWEIPHLPPADLDGHYVQRILFDAATAGQAEADAVVSLALAPAVDRAPVVDGSLTDWPPNEFNIAGDFRLINDTLDPALRRAPAESQTVAYFCRHEGILYIGLHAATPPRPPGPQRLTSSVTYEDLVPVGDDLVEILIDPTNQATQSDALYHVVLKSSGLAVFERGIEMTPSIGRHSPWPVPPPRHAVARTEFGWSAEIALPLDTFGPPSATRVWGLNIARLEPQRGEYSDWARAPRYCYDPRTLGNLIWPD